MQRLFVSLLMFFTFTTSSLACPAAGLINAAGNSFMAAARTGSAHAFSNAANRFADVNSLALFALGPYRRNLPANRKAEYVSLTRKFMGQFMAQYASRFSGTGITIIKCSDNLVTTKLSTGQGLTFRLRGNRRIDDVNVSGIWLAQTLRSRFVSVIRNNNGDVEALMKWLAD